MVKPRGSVRGVDVVVAILAVTAVMSSGSLVCSCKPTTSARQQTGTSVMSDEGVPSGAWSISMSAHGGERGHDTHTIVIEQRDGHVTATRTLRSPGASTQEMTVDVAPSQATKLWRAISANEAWELGDIQTLAKDAMTYDIELKTTNRSHTLIAAGVSQSPRHLRLVQAVQECAGFTGVSP